MSGNDPVFGVLPAAHPQSTVQESASWAATPLAPAPHRPHPETIEILPHVSHFDSSRISMSPSEKYQDLYEGSDDPPNVQPSSQPLGVNDENQSNPAPPAIDPPPRALSRDAARGSRRVGRATSINPEIDWIVPVEERQPHRKTLGERLQPTLDNAIEERRRCAQTALLSSYALNIAIGLQVLLGALTTAVSAATTGRSTSIATAVLGGLATLVASYLARARGSNEPDLSITRVKDLEHFIRECEAFQLDHGFKYAEGHDHLNELLERLRRNYENLLGNADGQRKLASPV